MKKNYYLTLDCPPARTSGDIRHAFRNLVRHYHPDIIGPNGFPFFQEIVEAYHVLSDSDRRRYYQRGLHDGGNGVGQPPASIPDVSAPETPALPASPRYFSNINVAWPSLDLVRERLLKNFRRGEAPRHQQTDTIDILLILSAWNAVAGGVAVLDVPGLYPCVVCKGSGQTEGSACTICDETGLVTEGEKLHVSIPAMVRDHDQAEIPLSRFGDP